MENNTDIKQNDQQEIKLKRCSGCKEFKPLSEFSKNKAQKDGYANQCKACYKKYRIENKDIIAKRKSKYYYENKNEIAEKNKAWYEQNTEHLVNYRKERYEEHKEEIKIKVKEYYQENQEKKLKYEKEYEKRPARYETYFDQLNKYEECRQDPDNPELLQVRCTNSKCREWFNPSNKEVRHRIDAINGTGNGECNFYCSDDCKVTCAIFNQHKHPKGFKPDNSRDLQPELRRLVLERDEHTCQNICCPNYGKDDIKLVCHHLKPLNESPIESADIDNCITLCEECHKEVHKRVGCTFSELKC